jgi:hypothetical protein
VRGNCPHDAPTTPSQRVINASEMTFATVRKSRGVPDDRAVPDAA